MGERPDRDGPYYLLCYRVSILVRNLWSRSVVSKQSLLVHHHHHHHHHLLLLLLLLLLLFDARNLNESNCVGSRPPPKIRVVGSRYRFLSLGRQRFMN